MGPGVRGQGQAEDEEGEQAQAESSLKALVPWRRRPTSTEFEMHDVRGEYVHTHWPWFHRSWPWVGVALLVLYAVGLDHGWW